MSRARRRPSSIALLGVGLALGCDADGGLPGPSAGDVDQDGAITVSEDVRITGTGDLVRLRGVQRIRGDLVIALEGYDPIELPQLHVIDGAVRAVGMESRKVSGHLVLPSLVAIGGDLELAWSTGTAVLDMPALERVGGHVRLSHGAWDLRLRALVEIGGELRLSDGNVESVGLDALARVGGSLVLRRFAWLVPDAAPLVLPALEAVGDSVEIQDGSGLALEAPALRTIGSDLELSDMALWLRLEALVEIGDDLRMSALTLPALALPELATVVGDVDLENVSGLPGELALASLETVSGSLVLRRLGGVERILLGRLSDLGRQLVVSENATLTWLDLASLHRTTSEVVIAENGALTVTADALVRAGSDLLFDDNARLDLRLPRLTEVVGTLRVRGGTLAALELGALTRIGRDLRVLEITSEPEALALPALEVLGGALQVLRSRFLDALVLPRLPVIGESAGEDILGDLDVRDNEHLALLDLEALALIKGDLVVVDNPRLPAASIRDELEHVVVGGTRTICGNGGEGACAP